MHRLATSHDLAEVFAIYMHEQIVPYLGFDPMPLAQFEAEVFRELVDCRSFYIYEVAGQIAGFYRTMRYPGRARHVAMLGTLAVRPELHGSGVARRMVGEAIACLRDEGVKRIELYAEIDNPRGIRFYERMGFEQEAVLRKFYKRADQDHYVDEVLMSLLFE